MAEEHPGTTVGTADTTQAPASPGEQKSTSVRECIEASGYSEDDLIHTPGTRIRSWEELTEEFEYLGLDPPPPPSGEGQSEVIVDIDEFNRWQRTEAACVEATGGGEPVRDPVAEAAYTEYALAVDDCMRGLGWDFPDPWPNPWGTGYRPIMVTRDIVPTDQEERTAFMADHGDCAIPAFEEYLNPLFSSED